MMMMAYDQMVAFARECGAYQGTLGIIQEEAMALSKATHLDAADLRLELEALSRRAATVLARYEDRRPRKVSP